MTAIEYIKRKNELIYKETGLILVPEHQIEEVTVVEPMKINFGSDYCPYCIVHDTCITCIMYINDNRCADGESTHSTIFNKLLERGTSIRDIEGMEELVNQFNMELKNDL
jgi:hypothetical protein